MIACENEECATEWFHLGALGAGHSAADGPGCAGLDRPPKGKWYCKDCIQELGIQPAREREPTADRKRKRRR